MFLLGALFILAVLFFPNGITGVFHDVSSRVGMALRRQRRHSTRDGVMMDEATQHSGAAPTAVSAHNTDAD